MLGAAEYLSTYESQFPFTAEEKDFFTGVLEQFSKFADTIQAAPVFDPLQVDLKDTSRTYTSASAHSNPYNAWAHQCSITSKSTGILSGHRIALKDNIAFAGVPCLLGTNVISHPRPWIPEIDATIVTRILEAGGTIAGKAVCENLSLSGVSATAATGPVHNPHAYGYNAGGSSSGCGALVGGGVVDMAMGTDLGGSIRLPAAWCGIYGLKPTRGLVPFIGIVALGPNIDHTGPMTTNVLNNALLLQAVAGPESFYDDRQSGSPPKYLPKYYDQLAATPKCDMPLTGMKIGVLTESFEFPGMDPAMVYAVKETGKKFTELGATIVEISVPEHLTLAPAVWHILSHMGAVDEVFEGHGGIGRTGYQMPGFAERMSGWQNDRWDELSIRAKSFWMAGRYILSHGPPSTIAKAVNLGIGLRIAYDKVLEDVDIILCPTVPSVARKLPIMNTFGTTTNIQAGKAANLVTGNTAAFNITGHPALSMPVGFLPSLDEPDVRLPAAAQLVGRYWDEISLYKVAYAFEKKWDWRNLTY